MKPIKRLPPQSPECVRDAAVVVAVHPSAEAFYNRERNIVQIEAKLADDPFEVTLGFGITAESAWADARATVERKPPPELPHSGSPTWSLQSDEKWWKDKSHATQPAQPEKSQSVSPFATGAFGPPAADVSG